MLDAVVTMTSSPGFFTSAMGIYDPSNNFDAAFKQSSAPFNFAPAPKDDNPFGFSPRTSPVPEDRKPHKATMLDLDGMSLGDPWTSRKESMLVDPNLRQSMHANKLHTSLPGSVRAQHGQITPPSDGSPNEEAWEDRDSSRRKSAPQSSSTASSNAGRRKRSSQASASSGAAEPKRKRRNTGKRQSSNASEPPETDEKRTKFLERNRVAASKCRQKKKEWTSNLEERARQLQANKTQLSVMASSLREEVLYLKGEMLEHKNCGCHRIRDYLSREAMALSSGVQASHFMPMQMSPNMELDPSRSMHESPMQSATSAETPGSDSELQAMLTAHMDKR